MEFTFKERCFLVNSTSHVYSKGLTSVTEHLESLLFVFCLDNFFLVFLPIAVINASASMVLLHGHELRAELSGATWFVSNSRKIS